MLLAQPDAVLCRLSARGNVSAYDVLFRRYRQPIHAFVFHLLGRNGSPADAEDITQEAFMSAFVAIGEKRREGSFKHWIYTIARNRTFDFVRARRPVTSTAELDDATLEMSVAGNASSEAENRAEFAWVVDAVATLPDRQRSALVMRELGGMSHAEIAAALETTVPATKHLINRGRASVGEAAVQNGMRPRDISKQLALAAPVLPLASVGLGLGASGASAAVIGGAATAGTATTASGAAIGAKFVATVMTVAALGGSAVVVERELAAETRGTDRAATSAPSSTDDADSTIGSLAAGGGSLGEARRERAAATRERRQRSRERVERARQRANREKVAKARKEKRAHQQNASKAAGRSGSPNDSRANPPSAKPPKSTDAGNSGSGRDSAPVESPAPKAPATDVPSNGRAGNGKK